MEKFVITKSAYAYISYDLKGLTREFDNRRYACFLITVKGKIQVEKHPMYRQKGPVLYVESTEFAVPPKQEVATFY